LLWGLLLLVAPCATAVVAYEQRIDVWATASIAGVAAAVVVGLFALTVRTA
jgi:hypothetical protein